jgi:hypothetical protein
MGTPIESTAFGPKIEQKVRRTDDMVSTEKRSCIGTSAQASADL